MENPKNLQLECATCEMIPEEDEVFSFLEQLCPLDFRYPESSCSNYDLDDAYTMESLAKAPIRSGMATLPDPSALDDGGLMVGKDGQKGYLDKELGKLNTFSFQNPEMAKMSLISFPTADMNSLCVRNEELSMARASWCEQPQIMIDQNDGNCKGDGVLQSNQPLRLTLSREKVSQYFYMTIVDAAKELNIGTTLLKKRCRELGIPRWPYLKLNSIQTVISNVQELGKSVWIGLEEKLQEKIMRLENERNKLEEIPDLQLDDNTIWLRQVCFKENYKKRKSRGTRSSNNS